MVLTYISLMINNNVSTSSCTCWLSIFFFWKIAVQILCHCFHQIFLALLFACITSLHILDISDLLDIWFPDTFSHSVGWRHFVDRYFHLMSQSKLHHHIFASVVFTFGIKSKNSLSRPLSRVTLHVCF